MMGSNGGLLSVERTCRQPIGLVESGPIGGCIGAGAYAEALGFKNVIAFDMGGTTAKCALVEKRPVLGRVRSIMPAAMSRASRSSRRSSTSSKSARAAARSPGSTRKIGCMSVRRARARRRARSATAAAARSRPSPMPISCSAGSIAERFLGGELRLDTSTAPSGRSERIAEPLGYRRTATASIAWRDGILSIATVIMAGAIKQVSVEHGLDPRDFVLFCYGGGGPLHASALARELSIPTRGHPARARQFFGDRHAARRCAARSRQDLRRQSRRRASVAALQWRVRRDGGARRAHALDTRIRRRRRVLRAACRDALYAANATTSRFRSQDSTTHAAIREAFDRDYRRRYGHADARAAGGIPGAASFGLRQAAAGRISRRLPRRGATAAAVRTRPVYFGGSGGMVETRVYDRAALADRISTARGPALHRGIRIDDAGLAGRPLRDRSARRNPHPLRGESETIDDAARCRKDRFGRSVDPITLEVIRHGLVSITNQIDANIKRTAFSPYIYEYNDFAVGLVDAEGQLVAQCTGGMPPFVADSVGMAVRDGLQDLRPRAAAPRRRRALQSRRRAGPASQQHGDVHADLSPGPNAPTLIGFFAINVHWIDIGGVRDRGRPTFSWRGCSFAQIKLWSKGEPIEEVYRIIENNTRLAAANSWAISRRSSPAACSAATSPRRSPTAMAFATFEPRRRDHSRPVGGGGARLHPRHAGRHLYGRDFSRQRPLRRRRPVPIKVKVIVAGDELTVDYSEIAAQAKGPINSGYFGGGQTTARVAFKYLMGADEMANEGTFRPLKLILPPGQDYQRRSDRADVHVSDAVSDRDRRDHQGAGKGAARTRAGRAFRHPFRRALLRPPPGRLVLRHATTAATAAGAPARPTTAPGRSAPWRMATRGSFRSNCRNR